MVAVVCWPVVCDLGVQLQVPVVGVVLAPVVPRQALGLVLALLVELVPGVARQVPDLVLVPLVELVLGAAGQTLAQLLEAGLFQEPGQLVTVPLH